jgi:hypothetical protein
VFDSGGTTATVSIEFAWGKQNVSCSRKIWQNLFEVPNAKYMKEEGTCSTTGKH